jgi:hypothetical protein
MPMASFLARATSMMSRIRHFDRPSFLAYQRYRGAMVGLSKYNIAGIGAWPRFYIDERQRQSHGYGTPRQVFEECLRICGRSDPPTGCASSASRPGSESGEMLACAHIPTGITANKGLDNSKLIEPAIALTAIGADIETGGVPL